MLMATRRPRRCLIWTPALLLALLGCGSERSAPPGTTTPEAEAAAPHVAPEALPEPGPASAEGETLLLQPPPAWLRVTEQIDDKLRLVEYLPAGHDEGNWNDRLIVESNELDPLPDPIQFLKALGDDLRTQCTESDHRNLSSGLENGYPTSVRMLMCRKENSSGRGRISFVKAIQGNEAFYVISRTRRSTRWIRKPHP